LAVVDKPSGVKMVSIDHSGIAQRVGENKAADDSNEFTMKD
jgi:hypothetical protein